MAPNPNTKVRGGSVAPAVVVAFIVAGVLFTLRMDYNWFSVFKGDLTSLYPSDHYGRLKKVHSEVSTDFFEFLAFLDGAVPEGEGIRPASAPRDNFSARMVRYYMLPIKTSPGARYLWNYRMGLTYRASEGSEPPGPFEPFVTGRLNQGALMEGRRVVASPVRPVQLLREGIGLYEALDH